MALIRHTRTFTLFQVLVVPALLLCAIFRKPVFQWIAVGASAVWLVVELVVWIRQVVLRRRRKRNTNRLGKISQRHQDTEVNVERTPESDLFLIRQLNYRITEQLKESYPLVSWLWSPRPKVEDMCKGGVWRIQLANADPFNYGDVAISPSGKLTITLLQAVALKDAEEHRLSDDDLKPEEMLERVDVKSWYFGHGEIVLAQMIDELNTQGHKELLIKEDGDVVITSSGTEQVVERIKGFPPRMVWEDFCQLLKEDEITASVQSNGLALAW